MTPSPRERRMAELVAIRAADPAQIIAIYKGIAGIPPDGPLPPGITFDAMIAAILDREEREARST
jgi:hypothetical protein